MFSLEFHSKISKSWYYCCNYITTKSATRHNRFASFILNETSRNFTRKNKNISMFSLDLHSKISKSWYYCCNYITTKSATRHNRFASFILNETSRNFTRKNKNISMFSLDLHSKISKSWYYCCNYITTKSATRHNRFASFILNETSRNFTRKNKSISMFSLEFHSKISKSWYYCCNYITTKSATRHNRFASFILYETSRNFTRKNKNISMFSTEFHSKISKSWYYCCNYITTKSATIHNRFASFILYETSRNFTRKNKNISMFSTEFHSKISKSWYYCCNYITTKSATRHNRFAFFILNETSRNFTRKNKNISMFSTEFHSKYPNRDIIAVITSRLNQQIDITGLPPSF